jgi:hypothetical protein
VRINQSPIQELRASSEQVATKVFDLVETNNVGILCEMLFSFSLDLIIATSDFKNEQEVPMELSVDANKEIVKRIYYFRDLNNILPF